MWSSRYALALAALVVITACGESREASTPGTIVGKIFLSTDVPAKGCRVLVEGTPLSGRCDSDGLFVVNKVPPGVWNLAVLLEDGQEGLPQARLRAGVNEGQSTQMSDTRLLAPGAIAGRIPKELAANAVVVVPELGAATVPNSEGAFLLSGVAPGARDVQLLNGDVSHDKPNVMVLAGRTTLGVTFDTSAARESGTLEGTLSYSADGKPALRLQVLNLAAQNAASLHVVDRKLEYPWTWKVELPPGLYQLRAMLASGDSRIQATLPLVMLRSGEAKVIDMPLTVPPWEGDLDGDGVPNAQDADADGDGHLNDADRFPYDPAEWSDSDDDGVGDRADVFTNRPPTPSVDLDQDGRFDFEDNCQATPNPTQDDTDYDTVGDACDLCPGVDDKSADCSPVIAALHLETSVPELRAGQCSPLTTVRMLDQGERPISTKFVRAVGLESASGSVRFFTDAACATPPVQQVELPVGATQATFYFKATRAGAERLEALSPGVARGLRELTILPAEPDGVGFRTPEYTLEAGVCSPAVEVVTVDGFGNPVPFPQDVSVRLTPDTGGTDTAARGYTGYFIDDACSAPLPATQLGQFHLTIPAGGGSARFYFRRNASGPFALSVSPLDIGSGTRTLTQQHTLRPSAPKKLAFLSPAQTVQYGNGGNVVSDARVPTGGCSKVVEVGPVDAFGNPRGWTVADKLQVSTSSFQGGTPMALYTEPSCEEALTPRPDTQRYELPVTAGQPKMAFYVRSTTPGSKSLGASMTLMASTITSANQSMEFYDVPATRLRFVSGDDAARVGACLPGTFYVQRLDANGNPTGPSSDGADLTVTLQGTRGLKFYGASGCTGTPITTLAFHASESQRPVYVMGDTVGDVTLTASATGLESGTWPLQVLALPGKLALEPQSTRPTAHQCMPVTIRSQAADGTPLNVARSVKLYTDSYYYWVLSSQPDCSASTPEIAQGQSSVTAYVRRDVEGVQELRVYPSYTTPYRPGQGREPGSGGYELLGSGLAASVSLSVEPAAPVKLEWVDFARPVSKRTGECSEALRVQLRDAYGNRPKALADLAFTVRSADPGGLLLYMSATDCSTAQNAFQATGMSELSLTLPKGQNEMSLYARSTLAKTQRLFVEAPSLPTPKSSELTWSVTANDPYKLIFIEPAARIPKGQCRDFNWATTDRFTNPVTLPSTTTVAWKTEGEQNVLFSEVGCTKKAGGAPAGVSSGKLYVQATLAGDLTLVLSSGTLSEGRTLVKVDP